MDTGQFLHDCACFCCVLVVSYPFYVCVFSVLLFSPKKTKVVWWFGNAWAEEEKQIIGISLKKGNKCHWNTHKLLSIFKGKRGLHLDRFKCLQHWQKQSTQLLFWSAYTVFSFLFKMHKSCERTVFLLSLRHFCLFSF